jgi:hypothetical protein
MARKPRQPFNLRSLPLTTILVLCWLVGGALAFAGGQIEDPTAHIAVNLWVPTVLLAVGTPLLALGGIYFTLRETFREIGPQIVAGLRSNNGCYQQFTFYFLIIVIAAEFFPVPLAFSHLAHDLYLMFGGFTGAPHGLTYSQTMDAWDAFAFSWMLDSVTVNITQIFNSLPTSITPTEDWAKWLLCVYCIALDLIVVAGLYNLARVMLSTFRKPSEKR